MGVAVENIELVAGELRQRLGAGAVVTDGEGLDAYESDTYWKAIASRANGSPLGRPDLAVLARSDDDVATVLRLANQFGVPVLALRVVTPVGELIDTLPVPRHAVGPELTQLFIGSEGTLGVITRATLQLAPLPAKRRFEAAAFPSVGEGIH